jgi:hypothetical protein
MRIVQLTGPRLEHRIAMVEGHYLRLLRRYSCTYELVFKCLESGEPLGHAIADLLSDETLDYDAIYEGESEWDLRPAFTHDQDESKLLVSGTGLTHKTSAQNRNSMHEAAAKATLTDSMRMYYWGLEGGIPARGEIGVQPEWFYKGDGRILRGHNEPLVVPPYSLDGGEEGEIAGVYVIDYSGRPRRVGMTIGNEFSDHEMEKLNYLYLAPSKLRNCSIGPELTLDPDFTMVEGIARIERGGETVWSHRIASGEANMCHSLANIEHHHFKYNAHREPGDAHVHFYGASAFSYGEKVTLENGDIMVVDFHGFGRPLRNPVRIDKTKQGLVEATPLL